MCPDIGLDGTIDGDEIEIYIWKNELGKYRFPE